MKDQILELLNEEYPNIDFCSSDKLVTDGIIDSLTITGIIALLTMEYGVTITYEEITEENFNSIEAISKLVERLCE